MKRVRIRGRKRSRREGTRPRVWKIMRRLFAAALIGAFALCCLPRGVVGSPVAGLLFIAVILVSALNLIWLLVIFTANPPRSSLGRREAWTLLGKGNRRGIESLLAGWSARDEDDDTDEDNAKIEAALSQMGGSCSLTTQKELRETLARAFPYRWARADFRDSATDVLLAALRCLSVAGGAENVRTLRRVAAFPVPADAPNRRMIYEITRSFLGDDTPIIPLQKPALSEATEPIPGIVEAAPAIMISRRS